MTDARFGLFVGTFLPLDQLDWRSRHSTVVGLANQEIILDVFLWVGSHL